MKTMIDIIVVNWNAGVGLLECVRSIIQHGEGLVEKIVVVDNDSSDGSTVQVEDEPAITMVHAGANLGFGKACNRGARLCDSEYLLFLNPDAKLMAGSLAAALNFMRQPSNARVGVCGIQLIDEQGRLARSCSRFHSVGSFAAHALGLNRIRCLRALGHTMEEWPHTTTRAVDHVIGAFYLIRRSLFESLGGFDERFFLYFEDVDLSMRVSGAGWESVYLADAQAFHAGGGTSRQVKAARLFYSLRSRLLYGFKHFSPREAWTLVALTVFCEPVSRCVLSLVRGRSSDLRSTFSGYAMLWRALPSILGAGRR
jgi:hypothetical protein